MNPFRIVALLLTLSFGLQSMPVLAAQGSDADPAYTIEPASGFAMMADLLIARPLLIVATAAGAAVFVVSLPFSAMGGGIGAAGKALVVEPGQAAFVRCLGCTGKGYNQRE